MGALTFPAQQAPIGKSGGFTADGSPSFPSSPTPGNKPGVSLPPSAQSKGGTAADLLNGVIDAEERTQRNLANGLQPGEARGEAYGATIGSRVGEIVGTAAGARAGGKLGAAAGTFVGGPPGAATGGAAGVAVGGAVGNVAGTQLGERLGGVLGGAIGGFFDEPRPSPRPVTNPNGSPPPFQGGQCPGVPYEVTIYRAFDNPSAPNGRFESTSVAFRNGPISLIRLSTFGGAGYTYNLGFQNGSMLIQSGGVQTNPEVRIISAVPVGGGDDDCGDPLPDPDYYTPRLPIIRPTRPVPAPGVPRVPDIWIRPPAPISDDEPVDPCSPRLPCRPEHPEGPENPVQPKPDGEPGDEEPTPEEPKPPYSDGDCDPCRKIDQLQEKLEELFNQDGTGRLDLGECAPEEDQEEPEEELEPSGEVTLDENGNEVIVNGGATKTIFTPTPSKRTPASINGETGQPADFKADGGIESEEDGSLNWDGTGLAGLYNFAIATSRALSAMNQRLACLDLDGDSPIVIYPNDVYSEFELQGRLTLEFTTLDAFPKQVVGNSRWSLDIPNPLAEYDWATHFDSFRLTKGNWYGRCMWSSSGIRSGAYCASFEEAQKLIDYIRTLTTLTPERERVTSSGRTGMSTAQVRIIRAVKTTIVGGQVVDAVCYKPPTTQP